MNHRKTYLFLLFTFILIFPSLTYADGPYLNIPPTNAFDKIHSDNGTIDAMNFSMPLNIKSGSGISVKSNNSTHTVIISNTATSSIQGTYNTTQANNANINSGGYKINFINGSGSTVHVQNSGSGTQVNVTVSSTGSGGTVTSVSGTAGNITSTGGNTPIINTGSNVVVTGGATQIISKNITSTGGITMSGANFTYGPNYIKSNNYQLSEHPIFGSVFQPISGNNNGLLSIAPSGTSNIAALTVLRTSNLATNLEYIQFRSDALSSGTFDIISANSGTGTLRPINIDMFTTKLLSFNTVKTITSYVQNIWTPISDPTTAFTNAIWKSSTNADVLKYRNNANTTTYNIMSTLDTLNFTTSSNKTGVAGFNMLGDGVTLTPAVTGRAEVTVSGYGTQNTAASGGAVQIRQITGGCPANGATVTGTALGSNVKMTMSATTTKVPFSLTAQVTGLAIGTKYCFELTQQSITSGTFTVFNIVWAAKEI